MKAFCIYLRLLTLFVAVATSSTFARAAEKAPTVYPAALLNFEERGSGVKDYGAKVADVLFARLAVDPSMYLVDRIVMQKTLAEQSLGLTGAVDLSQAPRVGQLTGAQLLITGSVLQVDKQLILVAKIIGTQTSRVVGASVEGKITDDLAPLVGKLSESIVKAVSDHSEDLVRAAVPTEDRLAKMKKSFDGNNKLPKLWIKVSEDHVGQRVIDPAVETEISRFANELGFTLIDTREGTQGQADLLITGEGFSELAGRVQTMAAVKARVELKVVDRVTGKVLFVDRQTTVKLDLAENIAGKSALQDAGAQLAERALPKLAKWSDKK